MSEIPTEKLVDIEDLIAGDVADDFASNERHKDRALKKRPKKVKKEELPAAPIEEDKEPADDDDGADDVKLGKLTFCNFIQSSQISSYAFCLKMINILPSTKLD